jgi:hypothetical protein
MKSESSDLLTCRFYEHGTVSFTSYSVGSLHTVDIHSHETDLQTMCITAFKLEDRMTIISYYNKIILDYGCLLGCIVV